jgi:hypothetical protein
MDDAGTYYNMRTGKPDPSVTQQALQLYAVKGGFLHKGTTIGSQGTEAADYIKEQTDFFKARLAP